MENREPFQLKGVILAYNLFQTLFRYFFLNGLMLILLEKSHWDNCKYFPISDGQQQKGCRIIISPSQRLGVQPRVEVLCQWKLQVSVFLFWMILQLCPFLNFLIFSLTCEPIDYSNNPEAIRALNLAWIFYISKFIDFADSIFFVLKKKFTHLSFLHVFHHGIMPFQTWWGPRLGSAFSWPLCLSPPSSLSSLSSLSSSQSSSGFPKIILIKRFVGGGHGGFAAFFNAGVHTVRWIINIMLTLNVMIRQCCH